MHLKLHIDQIVLDGIDMPRRQRSEIKAALEAELSHLFTTHGIPATIQKGGRISRLPADLTLTGECNPVQLGQQAAQSIYTCLQGGDSGYGLSASASSSATKTG